MTSVHNTVRAQVQHCLPITTRAPTEYKALVFMWMLVYLKDYGAVYPRRSIPFTNRKGIEEEWPLAKHIE